MKLCPWIFHCIIYPMQCGELFVLIIRRQKHSWWLQIIISWLIQRITAIPGGSGSARTFSGEAGQVGLRQIVKQTHTWQAPGCLWHHQIISVHVQALPSSRGHHSRSGSCYKLDRNPHLIQVTIKRWMGEEPVRGWCLGWVSSTSTWTRQSVT